ncbi:MAG TPA: F0F1 ATP synthase subunit gamma [Actinomycetota bacterium]
MGAQLRVLRRRIRSVQSTMKITRAMELIAASRIVKAQRRVEQATPYAMRITEAIRELAGVTEVMATFPLLQEREIRRVAVVVITSDRGLAGGYNSAVIKVAEQTLKKVQADGKDYRLHLAGKKGISYFRFRNYEIASQVTGVSDTPTYDDAARIGRRLMADFESGDIDQVIVCYTDFKSPTVQVATRTQVLPIQRHQVAATDGAVPALYEFEPEPGEILSLLLPRYVITVVYAAMLESSAAEHAARRRAMKVATDNADDLMGVLQRAANRQRQAEITTEILDIIGGAEALRKQKKTAAAR